MEIAGQKPTMDSSLGYERTAVVYFQMIDGYWRSI